MSERPEAHPDCERIAWAPGGNALQVFTPCHGKRVLYLLHHAVPGAQLEPVCRECGRSWLLQVVADDHAESGLRPVWLD